MSYEAPHHSLFKFSWWYLTKCIPFHLNSGSIVLFRNSRQFCFSMEGCKLTLVVQWRGGRVQALAKATIPRKPRYSASPHDWLVMSWAATIEGAWWHQHFIYISPNFFGVVVLDRRHHSKHTNFNSPRLSDSLNTPHPHRFLFWYWQCTFAS